MGDSLYLCNGDILFLNGGHQGVAVSCQAGIEG